MIVFCACMVIVYLQYTHVMEVCILSQIKNTGFFGKRCEFVIQGLIYIGKTVPCLYLYSIAIILKSVIKLLLVKF